MVVPPLHVRAPVVPITAPGGVLLPPGDPTTLGWWREGAVPGAKHGGALVTGHTVHTGGGAFDHLDSLRDGDAVVVRTREGRIRYTVTGVTVYRKARLASDAARVFAQSGPGRLVLVTCDDWNGTTYLSNAVVFADPA
ncbi:MAG: class F sortase [Nocardioidaceae bacterium]|nr:class F sortase [Nocardioidaceae bacterium]